MDRHLPPELISIIREFAKPQLRFPKEYKEAMHILNHTEWPTLKKKLSMKNADQVLKSLNAYTQAVVAKRNADKDHDGFQGSDFRPLLYWADRDWDEHDRLRKVCRDAMHTQTKTFNLLMRIMYGDWPLEDLVYTDTEEEEDDE